MAIAASASAAAIEAVKLQQSLVQTIPTNTTTAMIEAEINKLKKGFASSPALLSFFEGSNCEEDDHQSEPPRQRSDSDPSVNIILEDLERLWIQNPSGGGGDLSKSVSCVSLAAISEAASILGSPSVSVGVPLMRSDPFLSASHVTLENYQINID
jgi:hypothetical protein